MAIEEQTKTGSAYAAIKDVDTLQKDDRMESFFLAETLKYLYLLQNDNHTIDLLNTVSRTFTDRPAWSGLEFLQVISLLLELYQTYSTYSILRRTRFGY